jgi:hypothetical protein
MMHHFMVLKDFIIIKKKEDKEETRLICRRASLPRQHWRDGQEGHRDAPDIALNAVSLFCFFLLRCCCTLANITENMDMSGVLRAYHYMVVLKSGHLRKSPPIKDTQWLQFPNFTSKWVLSYFIATMYWMLLQFSILQKVSHLFLITTYEGGNSTISQPRQLSFGNLSKLRVAWIKIHIFLSPKAIYHPAFSWLMSCLCVLFQDSCGQILWIDWLRKSFQNLT